MINSFKKVFKLLVLFMFVGLWCCSGDDIKSTTKLNSSGGSLTVINAKIWTGDESNPWATAMTIINGKITAMDDLNPADTVLDAGGRLIVPGFWDGHTHPQTPYVLTSPEAPTLFDAKSPSEALEILKKYVEAHPEDKYPRLFGWMGHIFKDGEAPTREAIDEIVSDRPVYLVHNSGHAHWANTKALEIAGVLEKDPEFLPTGFIQRDPETGLATGYLQETELGSTAGILLESVKKQKPLSFKEQVQWQQTILEKYPEVGVTSLWTKDGDFDIINIYEQILRKDALPVRAILDNLYTPYSAMNDIEVYAKRARELSESDLPTGFLWADGVKLMVDLPFHAWMFEPYADEPDNYGYPVYEMGEFRRQVFEAAKYDLKINLLVIGDRAAHEGLNVLEEAQKAYPEKNLRPSIEHADFLIDTDVARFKALSTVSSMNPIGLYPDVDFQKEQENHYGKERLEKEYMRYRSLLDAGAVVVNGSDFPLAPMDPMLGIHLIVTGTDIYGNPKGGLWPHELIGVEEALKTYTVNTAYQAHREDSAGMLKAGYDGDFVMMSENFLDGSFDKSKLAWVKVVTTVFNGHIIYEDYTDKVKTIEFGYGY